MNTRPVVFMWENFGPMHSDRCVAVAEHFRGRRKIIGLELGGRSDTYDWRSEASPDFVKLTLFPGASIADISTFRLFWGLLRASIAIGPADFFFCRYERLETLVTSLVLRVLGRRVFTINDSKFDDKTRSVGREILKSFYFLPYNGALVAGRRAGEYLEFLRFPRKRIAYGCDAISIARIRQNAASAPAPDGVDFESRHFTAVARLVPKKNLFVLLEAYSLYARSTASPRPLHLCGSGPLEHDLKRRAAELGIADLTIFHGFLESAAVSRILAKTVALLLVSIEEQFGLVIPEALSLGVPVIVSPNCGANDDLVRSGVNGFVVEPDNPAGIAYFMELIGSDRQLWSEMARAATEKAPLADVAGFVAGCEELLTA